MRNATANIALALVPTGWMLAVYGALSALGDYAPDTPMNVVIANNNRSYASLAAGAACLAGALWLAGRSFDGARKRALLVAGGVVFPMAYLLAGLFRLS